MNDQTPTLEEKLDNYFLLFDLPVTFRLDTALLKKRYQALLSQFHPDKHVNASLMEQAHMLDYSSKINQAYRALLKSETRANHLFDLLDCEDGIEKKGLSPDFLIKKMQQRECLDLLQNMKEKEPSKLETLYEEVSESFESSLVRFEEVVDCIASGQNTLKQSAYDCLQKINFDAKLMADIRLAIQKHHMDYSNK